MTELREKVAKHIFHMVHPITTTFPDYWGITGTMDDEAWRSIERQVSLKAAIEYATMHPEITTGSILDIANIFAAWIDSPVSKAEVPQQETSTSTTDKEFEALESQSKVKELLEQLNKLMEDKRPQVLAVRERLGLSKTKLIDMTVEQMEKLIIEVNTKETE